MDQAKVLAEVETGVMDKAMAEALVAKNTKVAIKAKALAEVETGVMDKVTVEVSVARNAKVAVKAKALAEARDAAEVWVIEKILANAKN